MAGTARSAHRLQEGAACAPSDVCVETGNAGYGRKASCQEVADSETECGASVGWKVNSDT